MTDQGEEIRRLRGMIDQLTTDYIESVRLYRVRDAQAAKYHDRLQIDPGGSDRIDALEAALLQVRHEHVALLAEQALFHGLFSDDETACESYAQALLIWNAMKEREMALRLQGHRVINEREAYRSEAERLQTVNHLAEDLIRQNLVLIEELRAEIGEQRTEIAKLRELVDAVGPDICKLALRQERRLFNAWPDCECRTAGCGHRASRHVGEQGACIEPGCACGPGGWS